MGASHPQAKLPESEEEQHERLVKLLEERLEKHDNNRKTVQNKFEGLRNKLRAQVDGLEDRINKELCENFSSEEDRLQAALNELRGNNADSALQEAKRELLVIQSYEIIENKKANNDLATFYELKAERRTIPEDDSVELTISEAKSPTHNPSNATEMSEILCDSDKFADERERLIELLEERIEEHENGRKAVQDKLHEICTKLRAQIDELEDKVNKELEEKFTLEDNRLQTALNELRGNRTANALQKVRAELFVEQSYDILENNFDSKLNLTTLCELKAKKRIVPELMEMRKPTNIRATGVNRGSVSVVFASLNLDEERVLSDRTIVNPVKYKCLLFKKGNEQESKEYPLGNNDGNNSSFTFTPVILETETTYGTRVKMVVGDRESEWSDDVAEFTTPEFRKCCVWKECPDYVNDKYRKYSVDGKNPRIATKNNDYGGFSGGYCTIIGNASIPLNTVIPWSIKVLESEYKGHEIYIGVAPNDINQNINGNHKNCGWYFNCYWSTLFSGPPHNYSGKKYGLEKDYGQYVHTGDSVGVVVDATKGDLSFVLDGVNLGVAFEGIPLDKPLVPCVILYFKGDSVGFI